MGQATPSAFNLPPRPAAKAGPALVSRDERHFADIAASLKQQAMELSG